MDGGDVLPSIMGSSNALMASNGLLISFSVHGQKQLPFGGIA